MCRKKGRILKIENSKMFWSMQHTMCFLNFSFLIAMKILTFDFRRLERNYVYFSWFTNNVIVYLGWYEIQSLGATVANVPIIPPQIIDELKWSISGMMKERNTEIFKENLVPYYFAQRKLPMVSFTKFAHFEGGMQAVSVRERIAEEDILS